jgi:CheY-like chemotaxis protein
MRVLIVDDDPLLGDALAAGLKQRGFESDRVQDGRDAQAAIRVEPFAAIVLDLGLPGLGGLELLRGERGRGNKVPVLILIARDAVQDRIALARHMDIALNDGPDGCVSGDAGLLSILFGNVIDNALRYSAPGTKVDVDMEVAGSEGARDGPGCRSRHSCRAARERRPSLLSSAGDAGTGQRARAVDRAADRRPASGHHPARLAGDDHRTTGHDCSTARRG